MVCHIRAGEVVWVRVRGTVWNTLKRGGVEKRGGGTKILKGERGKLDQGLGALKRDSGTPLRTMDRVKAT